jgi:hypothetical protein
MKNRQKELRSRVARPAPSTGATEIDLLHDRLKAEQNVTDVKFAFGEVKGRDVGQVFDAVSVALRAAVEMRTMPFEGVKDSYSRKRRK